MSRNDKTKLLREQLYLLCEEKLKEKIESRKASGVELNFSQQLPAVISEIIIKIGDIMTSDLVMFAEHAKRKTINSDDIFLFCRRNDTLV
ncbi:Centromere protin S [Monocercomonoides exilis]|uniref:Centromere protin S n=1 Tax=Monocercomonoides exilis TaxID=2049356 RepID=UPI00355A3B43|nr:Centromere protin S [Monocercomonoides exilis]|eukprot:MONOS_1926.1-p1 / transcript=MONOS_1926.1 / gene=MONOS_1926 / organism=Monocercomonoides_exilis_PA203 / gene_product=Centromere protin S / transcript_product=Centromere protin S / location=Mono_scaffold00037:15558-16022(-) / protein_length=90 / sequence_SO=supercontig / SO=protein_coding / is_pseudo=false